MWSTSRMTTCPLSSTGGSRADRRRGPAPLTPAGLDDRILEVELLTPELRSEASPDMCLLHQTRPERLLGLLAGVLILKVTQVSYSIITTISYHFPSDFLRGRELLLWRLSVGLLHAHSVRSRFADPGADPDRRTSSKTFPTWHRYLGRIQVVCVLFFVTPSGLWMSRYAAAGPIAAVGLAALAFATAVCVSLGAWAARARRFADHRRWMWRCYLLLCSAVVLRLIGGLATVAGVEAEWLDPLANWISWLIPILLFEFREWLTSRASSGCHVLRS